MDSPNTVGMEFRWAAFACAVALAFAPIHWPYGYYQMLRVAVTAIAIWLAAAGKGQGRMGWAIAGIGLALLFNPLLPVYLDRQTWAPIDLAAAGLLVVAAIKLPRVGVP